MHCALSWSDPWGALYLISGQKRLEGTLACKDSTGECKGDGSQDTWLMVGEVWDNCPGK